MPVGSPDNGHDAGTDESRDGGIAVPQVTEVCRADAVVQLGRDARPLGGPGLDDGPRGTRPFLDDAVALPGKLQAQPDQGPRFFGVATGPGDLTFDLRQGTLVDLVANAAVQD